MEETARVLTHDTIAETEKVFGDKHWSEFSDLENLLMLGRAIEDNKRKAEHLKSIGDINYKTTWDEFKNMLVSYGFKEGLSYPLNTHDYGDGTTIEEAIIYYHLEKGLILWATSYWNRSTINSGNCYCELKSKGGKENKNTLYQWLSSGCVRDNVCESSFDIREGMFYRLEMLESAGVFQSKWSIKNRFMWFVDWNEKEVEGYDYKKITKDKIMQCPQEMQDIIYGGVE